ncbi:MAG: hypothetical protein EOP46_14420 [Sphingobacteriaceae bacterium]|nr:MAG: hypothetical protein EOP46_14420 [Sphingobacteriaceae bacterium]
MKSIFVFLLVCNVAVGFGQDSKKAIENGFIGYSQTLVNKDFHKMADYITEEVFTYLAKDDYIRLMQKTFNSPDFDITIKDPKLVTIGDVQNIKGKYYSIVDYSNLLNIKLKPENDGLANTMAVKRSLESGFGAVNVNYDEKAKLFVIHMKSKMCAISADGVNNWKFVALEANLKPMLGKFLPVEILKAI